jgi:spectinomycin phosphotransferase
MLEKPDLPDESIIACLKDEFNLLVSAITFLPLGADLNTAVYRADIKNGSSLFVKLRKGSFNEIGVTLPRFLSDQGIGHIIPPLPARDQQLWVSLADYKLILYPYREGRDGYEVDLSDRQWIEYGQTLKRIHDVSLPVELARLIKQESYSPYWREELKKHLERIKNEAFTDPIAVRLAGFLTTRRSQVLDLIKRTASLAQSLRDQPREYVLCHSDIHPGNLLINVDDFFIVDWDDPILAPIERDLMFIGAGISGKRHKESETALFFQGYGQHTIDPTALTYFRCARIIEDLAVECDHILSTGFGDQDREQSFKYLRSNFAPGGEIEIAQI